MSLSILFTLAGVVAAPAPEAALDAITGEAIARHVEVLASDEFQGRFPGTEGEQRTLDYLSRAFAAAGARPGNGDSYLQPVPLLSSSPAAGAKLVIVGEAGRAELSPPGDVVLASPAGRARVRLADTPVVFAGYGITAPEWDWDDYAGADVSGKLVFVLWGEPDREREDFFRGRPATRYAMRDYKAREALARGAAGLVFIHEPEVAGYPWGVLSDVGLKPRYELADSDELLPLQAFISKPSMDAVLFAAGADYDTLKSQAGEDGFRARELPLHASLDLASEVKRFVSHNVVAVIPGTRKPAEWVVYTAHWDHVGVNPALEDDPVFNGALDNATGTAALLVLARAYAGLESPPERGIVFLATTAEEQGLLGAHHYVRHPTVPLPRIAGVINMDSLFPIGATRGLYVTGMGSSGLEDYLEAPAQRVGRRLLDDPSPEFGAYFRSDHYPFVLAGIPAVFAIGGLTPEEAEAGGPLVERQSAFGATYHQPTDEYDPETWDMAGIVQDVTIYFEAGHALATSEHWPEWRPGSGFSRPSVAAP